MENYNDLKSTLVYKTEKLEDFLKITGIKKYDSILNQFRTRIQNENFLITVVGEFNRGKSTLINAMLGVDILPVSIKPTTAVLHLIRYGEKPAANVYFKDNKVQPLPFNKESLEKFTAAGNFDNSKVKYLEILYPAGFLKDGTVIIDTPGVNDIDEQRLEITYGYMPMSDSTIFLFNASTPLKITEKIFLEEKVLSNNISSIFFVINKIDDLEEKETLETTEYFKTNVGKILKKNDLKLFPLSSKLALEGALNHNDQLTCSSGIKEFQKNLEEFLQGNEKTKAKLTKLSAEFRNIALSSIHDLESELVQLEQSKDNLSKMRDSIHQVKASHKKVFEDLLKYNQDQKVKLINRVVNSLLKRYKELEDELLFRIDLEQRDLSVFAEKELPRKVNLTIKQWIDQNKPSIDRSLEEIAKSTLAAFEKHFSKKPVLNSLVTLTNYDGVKGSKGVKLDGEEKLSKIGHAVFGAGAVILGGAVAILTHGIGYPVFMAALSGGGISQRFVGGHLAKKEIEKQKKILTEEVPNSLRETFSKLQTGIDGEISNYFTYFEQQLKKEFENVFNELEAEIKEKIEAFDSQRSALDARKNNLCKAKEDILQLIGEGINAG